MKGKHSRREILRKAGLGLGLTLSPTVLSNGGGAIERTVEADLRQDNTRPVQLPTVRSSLLFLQYPDAPAVRSPSDRQFVFLDVMSEDMRVEQLPSPADFAFRIDNNLHRAGSTVEGVPLEAALMQANDIHRGPYSGRDFSREMDNAGRPTEAVSRNVGQGVLIFSVPSPIRSEDVAVELRPTEAEKTQASWNFDPEIIERLRRPPSFEITAFETPNQVERGKREPAKLTVRNTGGRDDTFHAVLGIDGAAHPTGIELAVPAGAERSWEGAIQFPPAFEDVDEMANAIEFVLDLGEEQLRRNIEIMG